MYRRIRRTLWGVMLVEMMVVQLATGLGLGLLPLMPGTFGSLLGLPLAWWLLNHPARRQAVIMMVLVVTTIPLCHWASMWLGGEDLPQIVADEYLVFPVSVLGLASMPRLPMLLVAFVSFRLFDALKLPPVNLLEAVGGGLGIVLDDLMAAIYTWLVMLLVIRLWRCFSDTQSR